MRAPKANTLAPALERYVEAGARSLFAICAEMTRLTATPVIASRGAGTLATLEPAQARRLQTAAGAIAWTFARLPERLPGSLREAVEEHAELVAPLLQSAALLHYDRVHPWALGSQATLPNVMRPPLDELQRLLGSVARSQQHSQQQVDRHQRALMDIARDLTPVLASWSPSAGELQAIDERLVRAGRVDYPRLARKLVGQREILEHWVAPDEPTATEPTEAYAALELPDDAPLEDALAALPHCVDAVLSDLRGSVARGQDGPRQRWLGTTGALMTLAKSQDVTLQRTEHEDRTQTAVTRIAATPARVGRYRVQRELGRGGMATVYAAHDETLDRLVALKVAHPALATEARARFAEEVRIAAQLQHPGIAPVYDAGIEAGNAWLAMRLIEGPSLADADRPLGLDRALAILGALASTVDYMHAQQVVHRDIKPSNVLLQEAPGEQVRPLLTDFGIARAEGAESHTRTGNVIGTHGWIAPEVMAGAPATAAADIWALARLLVWMLGETPTADPRDPTLVARLGEDRHRVVLAALDPDPARRPATAGDLRDALHCGQEGADR